MPASDYTIDLHDVQKTYRGRVHALRGIEMRVHRGEIFGLLGPNGAGKSTLVKIMMTVVKPTRIKGTMLGKPIGDKATLARVGYLPEHHRMPQYLTGRQVLNYYGALAKVDRTHRSRRADELLATVGMTDWANKRINSYSKGMLQRIGLAQALINDPDLVVLDEPTDGVDPVGRREIRDVLTQLRDQGKTVFLNSHLLSELEMVCDRVSILVQGQVSQQGTIHELTAESLRYEIDIEGAVPPDVLAGIASARSEPIAGNPSRTRIILTGADPAVAQPMIDRLRQRQITIISVRPMRESLEDLFMRAVTDPTTGRSRPPGAVANRK
ncbi:MAG TPA: ABC transporter ATP-binding protein [Phycisphaerales bacterium]|nr:ABC transporter ATP-binding protein [Phycisphaerales bacterium]HRQ76279.1 ABC transporter ATP-binding protein [Phycisphaerales bacterium]